MRRFRTILPALVIVILSAGAAAQQENPVYVDDSPRAWELFRLARDQAKDNAGEAVRLYQELLDDYAMKLLPIADDSTDHFLAVRTRVLAELAGNPELLERSRLAETAEARRLLDAEKLERLAITRPLTEPGLDALLRLAQNALERGWFHSALDWLDEAAAHPDLHGRSAAHCWYMIGASAHYLGRTAQLNQAVRELSDLGPAARPLADQLDRLVAGVAAPEWRNGLSPLDRAVAADLDQLVGQPIWSMSLEDTPLGRHVADALAGDQASRRLIEQMRRSGALLTAAPTVAGSSIYINEGRTVHGVDRFTGRPLWAPYQERRVPPSMEQSSRQIADINVVAVRDGSLVTISGHAYADAAKSERTVICLDSRTGEQRWSVRIAQLSGSDELEGLFPYGAPVIGEGLVFVAARKVSRQLLTSCYVIALDLDDGSLVWTRHVASSGGIRTRLARPFSNLLYYEGDLAVATAIGAVLRIDAATGRTRWLHRYNPPLSPFLAERRPWEVSGPIMTGRGLVAIRPDHRRIVLLDWDTGHELESVSASGRDSWNAPQYLLAGDELIFGVGTDIRAFRPETLDRPIWVFPGDGTEDTASPDDLGQGEIRGRVQLVDHGLLVPSDNAVLVVDDQSGRVVHQVEVESGGNPLAVGPQMIMASSDQLAAYMPLERAEQMLRRQIAMAPDDPGPALALMRLGVRVRDLDLSLEAAELVIGVIDAAAERSPAAARQELFEILLELDDARVAANADQGEALHAMIGLVAQEPIQRVEHLLAYGDWLVDHALGRAVEAYQTILSTPELAATPRLNEGLIRPASVWAAERIGRLIETRGRRVYQPQADFAAGRLDRLRRGQRDPRALVALGVEFPFSDAGVAAIREAALIDASNDDYRLAAASLSAGYRLAPDRARARALLGLLAALGVEAGWNDTAQGVLRYVVDTYGDVKVETASTDRVAAAWLAELESADVRSPRVGGLEGVAERLTGSLVPPWPGSTPAPPDRAVIYDPPQLAVISRADRPPEWSTVLGVLGQPHLLRFDERGLLLWVTAPGDDPAAVMLDPGDGSRRWTTTIFDDVRAVPLRAPGRSGIGVAMPGGKPFNPSEVIPLVGEHLVVVRRSGEVMALDLGDGRTPIWQRLDDPVLDQVHLARLNEVALVLAGTRTVPETGDRVGVIAVLDPGTGRTLHEITPRDGAAVQWLELGPLGLLTYGNGAALAVADMLSGRTGWVSVGPETAGTPRGWIVGGTVIVESPSTRPLDGSNPMRARRLVDGAGTEPFEAPVRGEWDRLDLRNVVVDQGRIFGHYGQRVIRFDRSGAVLGADVVSDHRDYQWLLPTADRLLLVSQFKTEQVVVPDVQRRQTEYTYRLYALSANCKLMSDSYQLTSMMERLERAAVIDGWLLLSTSSETLAIPLANE